MFVDDPDVFAEATVKSQLEELAITGGISNTNDFMQEVGEIVQLYKHDGYIPTDGISLSVKPSIITRDISKMKSDLRSYQIGYLSLDDSIKSTLMKGFIASLDSIPECSLDDNSRQQLLLDINVNFDIESLLSALIKATELAIDNIRKAKRETLVYQLFTELAIKWFEYGGMTTPQRGTLYVFVTECSQLVPAFQDMDAKDRSAKFSKIVSDILSK